jgi:hypothetical protein
MQGQLVNGEKQLQDALHRLAMLEMSTKQEIAEVKAQMNYYKNKYEDEANNLKKTSKLEA